MSSRGLNCAPKAKTGEALPEFEKALRAHRSIPRASRTEYGPATTILEYDETKGARPGEAESSRIPAGPEPRGIARKEADKTGFDRILSASAPRTRRLPTKPIRPEK